MALGMVLFAWGTDAAGGHRDAAPRWARGSEGTSGASSAPDGRDTGRRAGWRGRAGGCHCEGPAGGRLRAYPSLALLAMAARALGAPLFPGAPATRPADHVHHHTVAEPGPFSGGSAARPQPANLVRPRRNPSCFTTAMGLSATLVLVGKLVTTSAAPPSGWRPSRRCGPRCRSGSPPPGWRPSVGCWLMLKHKRTRWPPLAAPGHQPALDRRSLAPRFRGCGSVWNRGAVPGRRCRPGWPSG